MKLESMLAKFESAITILIYMFMIVSACAGMVFLVYVLIVTLATFVFGE